MLHMWFAGYPVNNMPVCYNQWSIVEPFILWQMIMWCIAQWKSTEIHSNKSDILENVYKKHTVRMSQAFSQLLWIIPIIFIICYIIYFLWLYAPPCGHNVVFSGKHLIKATRLIRPGVSKLSEKRASLLAFRF